MEEIGDDCLRELLKFVRAVKGPKGAADDEFESQRHVAKATAASKPKKNKPMGKKEQEDSIKQIQEQLRNFQANASGSDQSPSGKLLATYLTIMMLTNASHSP